MFFFLCFLIVSFIFLKKKNKKKNKTQKKIPFGTWVGRISRYDGRSGQKIQQYTAVLVQGRSKCCRYGLHTTCTCIQHFLYSKPGIRSTGMSKSERFDAMRAVRLSSCEIQLLPFVPGSPWFYLIVKYLFHDSPSLSDPHGPPERSVRIVRREDREGDIISHVTRTSGAPFRSDEHRDEKTKPFCTNRYCNTASYQELPVIDRKNRNR